MLIMIFGNHRRLVPMVALGTLLCLAAAAPARAGIADAVKAQTLPNGLKVLVLENHKAPLATFNVFYKVGSRNEQFGKTGLSHLCEHLMFSGTKKLGPEEFSQIIQQNGGEDNAFTEEDFTDYFETINKDHLDVPITLEADRMAQFRTQGVRQGEARRDRGAAAAHGRQSRGRARRDGPRAGLRGASVSLAGDRMVPRR